METDGPMAAWPDTAIHPGELLSEEIEARGLTQRGLAETMRRPVQAVNEICRGRKAITAQTALELESALGISARLWMGLQVDYDLTVAFNARASAS